ncbi:MAG: S9 family peptidase, partial [Pseudomonadota bacterium]
MFGFRSKKQSSPFPETGLKAPVAPKQNATLTQFKQTRVDPYAWIRDENWRDVLRDPSVLKPTIKTYLDEENAFYEASTSHLGPLRYTLFEEMRGRIKEDDSSPPQPDGPFEYLTRYREGGEHPIYARRPRGGGDETVLFDGDLEKGDADFFDIAGVYHSPDHSMVVYGIDKVGSEYFTLHVRTLETGEDRQEIIQSTDGYAIWGPANDLFYYVERDDNQRSKRVKRHILGTDPAADKVVYEEPDDAYFLGIDLSQSRAFIFITSSNGSSSEVRFIPTDADADTSPTLVEPRSNEMLYSVEHHGEHFYIQTNADGAIDFKVVRTRIDAPEKANWTDWLPARPGVFLRSFVALKDYNIRLESANALPRIVISDWTLENERTLSFEEAAYALSLDAGLEFDTDSVRVGYTSPATPQRVMDINLDTDKRKIVKLQEIPSGHDPDDYVVERLQAQARDGSDIPVTVLRRKTTVFDERAPMLLYGYGAYGISMPADFNTRVLSLVDRGVVYALAHIRGGADKGRGWYLDGKLDHKQNTFNDFVDAAAFLQDNGKSAPERTVIFGGSAGGLLVGACVNQAPERFAGVIGAVPFVDVLNTISDDTLPLTPPEWNEWGNPIKDEAAFQRIQSYSPYDNISSEKPYPAVLATGGIADYRVTYWEPAKW